MLRIKNLTSFKLLFFSGLVFINSQLFSAIGCLTYPHSIDKSEHELYRPIACNCPCQRTSQARGECADCHHFGHPDRGFKSVNQNLR